MRPTARALVLVAGLLTAACSAAAQPAEPPVPPEWRTPAEIADFEATPRYAETLAFLERVGKRLPEMHLGFYGRSGEGRQLPFVVVSKEKAFTPEAARKAGKPVVMIQNGIHAGEIEGKDACLMILRDLALGRHREILDAATLVILPIYNVDGHERVSPYNRPNQDGPHQGMGFRTTSDGHDLNRDFLKVETPEARALIGLIAAWGPHLHVDDHVTDGVDHDWVLTWSYPEAPQVPAPVDAWLRAHMPAAFAATERAGFRNGPYVDLVDRNDPSKGFSSWVGQPRYSSGYFPLRNRPSILIEMHSYKPYRQRVLGNRAFLLALLAEVGKDPASLVRAVTESEAAEVARGRFDAPASDVVVVWDESKTPDRIRFPVYAGETRPSVVTGQPLYRFRRGEVAEVEVPWFHRPEATQILPRPRGYLVLPGWPRIEARLRVQGLRVEEVATPAELEVETMRVSNPKLGDTTYQGLTAVTAKVARQTERRRIPAGALWIPADQPDFEVAVQLLEPEAPDSLFAWGLLSTILERKEYMEPRVLEGLAETMLRDPKIAAEWQEALRDPKFAGDRDARYAWWFRRTPYWDETVGLLPAFRVMRAPGLATRPWKPAAAPVIQ